MKILRKNDTVLNISVTDFTLDLKIAIFTIWGLIMEERNSITYSFRGGMKSG